MTGIGKFDTAGLEQFGDDLDKLGTNFNAFAMECVREMAARLLAKVIARTPVSLGELRKGWRIGEIKRTTNGYSVEISNPALYSSEIEYGHRTADLRGWVEGRFMLTISLKELEQEMPKILGRKLDQYMRRYLR